VREVAKKDEPYVLHAKDVQRILNIGRKQVYDFLPTLPFAKKIGPKQWRIPRDKFFEWLNSSGQAV